MIYLDNNATTSLAPEVAEAMTRVLSGRFGNPSSNHTLGWEAKKEVDGARESLADLLGAASADEIVFTSGGTESDNWAVIGAVSSVRERSHIVTTVVEHEAVRNICKRLKNQGHELTVLSVDGEGALDLDELRNSLRADTAIVSIMHANNETGVIFPVAEIAGIVKERSNALFHVDGVNAAGKVPIDLKNTAMDLYSVSAHKFHGPKGVGALYIRNGVELSPFHFGGGQEGGRRAGTEAVHQLAGMGAAARVVSDLSPMEFARELRDRLENDLLEKIPNSRLNGTADPSRRLPNTSNISFANVNGEMIQERLNTRGIYVSTGSACSSIDHKASSVLEAMNIPYLYAMGAIRFSLGRYNSRDDVEAVSSALPAIIESLRELAAGA